MGRTRIRKATKFKTSYYASGPNSTIYHWKYMDLF